MYKNEYEKESNFFFQEAYGKAKRVKRLPKNPTTALIMHQTPAKCCKEESITVVSFINILRAAFATIFFCQKITEPNCTTRENLRKAKC
jgi:hypothetical protein